MLTDTRFIINKGNSFIYTCLIHVSMTYLITNFGGKNRFVINPLQPHLKVIWKHDQILSMEWDEKNND